MSDISKEYIKKDSTINLIINELPEDAVMDIITDKLELHKDELYLVPDNSLSISLIDKLPEPNKNYCDFKIAFVPTMTSETSNKNIVSPYNIYVCVRKAENEYVWINLSTGEELL